MALENKLGLTSSADLAREEERLSKKKAVELFENGVLNTLPAGKFSTLQAIHKYLFEDIYDFAGKLRAVNLAKGNFRFAPLMYLEAALSDEINSREVYRKGIDHSYYYEGYTTFKAEEL
jgi:cell filamentation protein